MGRPHAYSSGVGAATQVKTGPGVAHNISLAPAAALATLIAYDNTSAAGSVICRLQGGANSSGQCYSPEGGVAFSKGLHIVITGVGAAYNAAYD